MPKAVSPLGELLARHTREGELYEKLPEDRVRCFACGHRCVIPPGHDGICRVRFNEAGTLKVPWGYVAALQVDPVEKKPFFHALPGARALSFGMLGCDYHCGYCQNWITSQALRDPRAVASPDTVQPDEIVRLARRYQARIVTSTYNEPLITSEWGMAVMKAATQAGLVGSYVSNGNGTPEVLDYIRPFVSLYKVDLKSFRDRSYRDLGGTLDRVLDTLRRLHALGFWVEVVTLVVPGFNDDEGEQREMAAFLASISPDIPWHVTAFHKDYKMTGPADTGVAALLRACEIGAESGLRYVYAGNLPGRVDRWEDTWCPGCHARLVERHGFLVRRNRVTDGKCPDCGTGIAGFWTA